MPSGEYFFCGATTLSKSKINRSQGSHGKPPKKHAPLSHQLETSWNTCTGLLVACQLQSCKDTHVFLGVFLFLTQTSPPPNWEDDDDFLMGVMQKPKWWNGHFLGRLYGWWFRNPAPVDMEHISVLIRFYTFQVVKATVCCFGIPTVITRSCVKTSRVVKYSVFFLDPFHHEMLITDSNWESLRIYFWLFMFSSIKELSEICTFIVSGKRSMFKYFSIFRFRSFGCVRYSC